MREKPIIFNTEMVRAILEGEKTQTRRVIKDKDIINRFDIDVDGKPIAYIDQATGDSYKPQDICPYKVGMTLWVKETWSKSINGEYVYRTNYGTTEDDSFPPSMFKWRPSIHMPRAAARIFLKVTNVRVERVQDISQKDIGKEGMWFYSQEYREEICIWRGCASAIHDIRRKYFRALWDSLNAKRGYGWETNPWIWVIEFERVV